MQYLYCVVIALFSTVSCAQASCIDATEPTRSVFQIRHDVPDIEHPPEDMRWIAGSAVAISDHELLTVAHVVHDMNLSWTRWKVLRLAQQLSENSIEWTDFETTVRIERVIVTKQKENIYVLQVQAALPGVRPLLHGGKLHKNEPLIGIGYTGMRLRIAEGRFVAYGRAHPEFYWWRDHQALIDMNEANAGFEADDRWTLSYGASGGAIYDCQKRLVGLISQIITPCVRDTRTGGAISCPGEIASWGKANNVMITIPYLEKSGEYSRK